MSGLSWKINRLSTMGLKEILHRTYRAISIQFEKMRFERGWKPLPSVVVTGKTFLFPVNKQLERKWQELFTLDSSGLSKLLDGNVDFFGHEPLSIGKPVQWHRDPVTGLKSSAAEFGKLLDYRNDALVGNVKFLWELGRHQHLVPLAMTYAVTGEQKYKKEVVSQIDSWIKQNPFNLGIHWCSALEVSLRLISWSIIHSLFHLRDPDDGLLGAVENAEVLGTSIYQHAWFVVHFLSRYSSANNHLIGELTGLWTACQVFDLGVDGNKWGKQAQRELEIEARKQVFSDGVNKEQATYYHLWVLEYLLFARLIGLRNNNLFSANFDQTISSMVDFLNAIIPGGGVPPQIGDADDGFVARFEARWPKTPYEDVLGAFEVVSKKKLPKTISQKSFWYGAMAGVDWQALAKAELKSKTAYPLSFPKGGYGLLGDKLAHLFFDAGSLGYPSIAAHGHADALSFCLAINGEWWFVDPGTYAYHSQPQWRNYFRGTAAHNTLEIDGQNQSQIGGPFLWTKHAQAYFDDCRITNNGLQAVSGSHKGYKGIVHTRKITYNPQQKEFLILDSVTGTGCHQLLLNFHFSPDITLDTTSPNIWTARKDSSNYAVTISGEDYWQWDISRAGTNPIKGWYSSALGNKQTTTTLTGKWKGDLPVNVQTCIKIQK